MSYIWVIIICLLFVALMFLPISFGVEYFYSKNAGKQKMIGWLRAIPFYKKDLTKGNKLQKLIDKANTVNKGEDDFQSFMNTLRFCKTTYVTLKPDVISLLLYLKNKLKIYSFTLHLDFGFEDAADTGIAAGAAYASVYSLSALIYNYLDVKKEDMDICVRPNFNKPCVDLYFRGIFRLRLVHIIVVYVKRFGVNNKLKKLLNNKKKVV